MYLRSLRVSRLVVWWMVLGEWRAHPGRVIAAGIAIAIGVALGFAVHLVNSSALDEFAKAVRTVNGDADLQVRAASAQGFDEALYPKIARVEGIAGASPVVELSAVENSRANSDFTLLGLDPFRAARVTPSLMARQASAISAGESFFDANSIFLSEAALRSANKQIGDRIDLRAAGQVQSFTIEGTLPGVAEDENIGVIDIGAAQWRFGQLGRLQRVDLRLADGADPARVRSEVAAILPADASIATRESEARRTDNLSRAYRVNLDMLALVALLTGAFLVFSAQSLSVTRRRPHFALLRVIGVERRGVLVQVLAEGAIVGGIGAITGLALGLGFANTALALFGGDLGGGFFRGSRPSLVFAPDAAFVFFALGLAAALFGSALPALEAARARPAIALKDAASAEDAKGARAGRIALVLLATGTGAAFLPAMGGIAVFGYLSIALLLAGGIAAMPMLARGLLAPLQRLAHSVPGDLALKRLWNAPSQAAIALCGIVASTSLMIAMAVMVTSFRASVDEWLTEVLPSDLYVHLDGNDGGMEPEVQHKLASLPGIAAIDFRKFAAIRLAPDLPSVTIIARTIGTHPDAALPMIGTSLPVPRGETPVWLSEPAANLYGRRPGERITLPIGQGENGTSFFVAGVWRDYARQQGSIAIDSADYTRLTGDQLRTDAAVTLDKGMNARAAIRALRGAMPRALARRVAFAEPRELRALSLRIFDRSFRISNMLQAVAILIGLAGVAATFSAQTLARTKEFGMLRHIGVSRRQIAAMLMIEGALLGAIGVVAGIGLGVAMGQVLIHVVNPQSFHWTMETHLPFALFAGVTAALIVAAAGTALAAGRRALSTDAVRAVREDW